MTDIDDTALGKFRVAARGAGRTRWLLDQWALELTAWLDATTDALGPPTFYTRDEEEKRRVMRLAASQHPQLVGGLEAAHLNDQRVPRWEALFACIGDVVSGHRGKFFIDDIDHVMSAVLGGKPVAAATMWDGTA